MTWLISAEKAREMRAAAVPNNGFEDDELRSVMSRICDASIYGYPAVFIVSVTPYNEERLKYLGYSVFDNDIEGIATMVVW